MSKERYKNDDHHRIFMKAMLIECPHTTDADESGVFFQEEKKSKGHDVCQDKILVEISMENAKKVCNTYFFCDCPKLI